MTQVPLQLPASLRKGLSAAPPRAAGKVFDLESGGWGVWGLK